MAVYRKKQPARRPVRRGWKRHARTGMFLFAFALVAVTVGVILPHAGVMSAAAEGSTLTEKIFTTVQNKNLPVIAIDPGHGGNGAGGNDPGAISSTYGYHEADLVLKIGLYLKEELETYRNVHVDMTRSDSYGTSATAPLSKVENRVLFAAGQHSDLLVSPVSYTHLTLPTTSRV